MYSVYNREHIGNKCPWKNQICDGLCNNCWAITNGRICTGDMKSKSKSNNDDMDFEGAILAHQEMMMDY